MIILFTISCIPRGQSRVRHCSLNGFTRAYKSKEQRLDEQTLQALMMPFKPIKPLSGAISLSVRVFMPIPKSRSKKWKEKAKKGEIFHTGKPDASNILKHIEDVMQSMRFFEDDKQLSSVAIQKEYGVNPGYEIKLMELEGEL